MNQVWMEGEEFSESLLKDYFARIAEVLEQSIVISCPKGFYCKPPRTSVTFSLPPSRKEIKFVKADTIQLNLLRGMAYEDTLICVLPFAVEKIGDNEYIARK